MDAKELMGRKEALLREAEAICKAAEDGGRDFTAEERQKVEGLLKEAKELKAQIDRAEGDEALKAQIMTLAGQMPPPAAGGAAGRGKTLGEQFGASAAWQAWLKQMAPSGHFPDGAKGFTSPPIEFKTLLTGDSATSGGAFVQTDYTGLFEPYGRRVLTVRDLISQRTTESDTVEFVQQTATVTQAAPVPEATATDGAQDADSYKPEGAMAFKKVQATVKTIAVWIPATKRALSDASQLRGIIDQELRADLEKELEDQMVAGTGLGEDLEGILANTDVQTQGWTTDLLTTARKAVTKVRVTGRARPTAWLVHPEDAEVIDLLKDTQDRYYYGGPAEGGVQRLWRYPVVESEAITAGTAIIGDWRKAVLWDRERATIQVSDSHSDFFVRNMVAILAEMRCAFGILRPKAFCVVDLSGAASGS